MTAIDTVSFKCTCGKRLQARVDQVGRTFRCPGCGQGVSVPSFTPATVGAPIPPTDAYPAATDLGLLGRIFAGAPTSIGELATLVLIAWAILAVLSVLLMFFGIWGMLLGGALAIVSSMAAGQQLWILLRARQTVLRTKRVPLLWGLIDLIAWEPTEGVLILKNKAVHFSDDNLQDGMGGVRFVYPALGEELALRVPLETQTLSFADHNVLTKEYLHLSVRGAMKWRIADIRKFYLLVSRELRSTTEQRPAATPAGVYHATDEAGLASARLIDATIEWLRATAEEQTRIVVSRVRSGLLIADRLASELPELRGTNPHGNGEDVGDSTHGLAGSIHDVVASSLERYGIAVDDVALHEVKLPAEIVQQCVEACKTAYLPLMASRQASLRKAELAADVELLGKEAVGTREILANAPAYALRDFLSEFVAQRTEAGKATAAATALAAGVLTDAAANKPLPPPSA